MIIKNNTNQPAEELSEENKTVHVEDEDDGYSEEEFEAEE